MFGVRIFPKLTNVLLRTHTSFIRQTDKKHHNGYSPLLALNVDMVNWFPLDYMHLVLLGAFKRLLTIWKGSWNKRSMFVDAMLMQCCDDYISCFSIHKLLILFLQIIRKRKHATRRQVH